MGSNETSAQEAYNQFWPKATEDIRALGNAGLKHQELPLARIKKIMKLDEDVKMISAEAPVLFAKAAEIFIHELTMRAWIHTEDNKRRTLQRNDIAMAITKYDQFDFLIDIVPRDDIKPTPTASKQREDSSVRMAPDQVSYYFQMAQQQQQQQQQQQAQPATPQIINQPTAAIHGPAQTITVQPGQAQQGIATPQIIQLQPTQVVNNVAPPPGGIQIVQQIVQPNGEIQQFPIQLTSQQMQLIRAQMTGGPQQAPLVIQAAPIQATAVQNMQQAQNQGQGQQQQSSQQGHIV